MTGPVVYMDDPKVHVFNFISTLGWVVIPGPKLHG
jgi:hypothetical protein